MTDDQLRQIADEALLMAKSLADHQNAICIKMPTSLVGQLFRKFIHRPFHRLMGWRYPPELRGRDVQRIVTSSLNAANAIDYILKQRNETPCPISEPNPT